MFSTGPVLTLRNNIFTNFGTASGASCYIAITSNEAGVFGNTGSSSCFNELYAPNGTVGRGGTVDYTTLAAWQAAYPSYGAGGQNIGWCGRSIDS